MPQYNPCHLPFNAGWLGKVINSPQKSLDGVFGNGAYHARIAIPFYKQRISAFYHDIINNELNSFCDHIEISCPNDHFGLIIDMENPTEMVLHDQNMLLDKGLRKIIARVGPVIIKNAHLDAPSRKHGHRNRFPHLNFHIDRSVNQPTQYSLFTRDPFDEEQQYPRTSSTLFTANIVAHLQGIREGLVNPLTDKGMRTNYTLFNDTIQDVIGDLVLEHRWDEPEGTGEISILDNRTVLHASYYRNPHEKGYKIGVRYLA